MRDTVIRDLIVVVFRMATHFQTQLQGSKLFFDQFGPALNSKRIHSIVEEMEKTGSWDWGKSKISLFPTLAKDNSIKEGYR